MQRKLSELKGKELVFVWEKNYKLQEEVRSCLEDTIMGYIDDYLIVLKSGLKNWSIGFCNYNTIEISNYVSFLNACTELQKNFCLLCENGYPTKYNELIEKGKHNIGEMMGDISDEKFNELLKNVEECVYILHDKIIEQINKELDYSEEGLMYYFFECWLDDYADDSYFINDDYELFLTQTKSLK